MEYKIKDLPKNERPRERLEKQGVKALSDSELLALVIRSGTRDKNVIELSREILKNFKLSNLGKSSLNELKSLEGIGRVKAGQIKAVFELFKRLSREEKDTNGKIECFKDALNYVKPFLSDKEEEIFIMICLDSKNRVISKNTDKWIISSGSVNRVNIDFRAIVKKALKENAAGVVLAHNHPGGEAKPTEEDIKLTKEIKETIEKVDIKFLDHIIVNKEDSVSLKEENDIS